MLLVTAGLACSRVACCGAEPDPDDHLRELERALARTGRPLGPGVTLAGLEHRFRDSPAAAGYVRALRLAATADSAEEPSPARGARSARQLRHGLGLPAGCAPCGRCRPGRAPERRRSDTAQGLKSHDHG